MRCGIPVDLFYRLNPKLLRRWQPYFNEALIQAEKSLDRAGWMHGYYVTAAIGACFSKKNKYPEEPYFKEPVRVDPDEKKHEFNDADRFLVFAAQFNKSFKQKDEKQ